MKKTLLLRQVLLYKKTVKNECVKAFRWVAEKKQMLYLLYIVFAAKSLLLVIFNLKRIEVKEYLFQVICLVVICLVYFALVPGYLPYLLYWGALPST